MLWQGEALNYSKRGLLALRQQVATVFQDPDQQIFYTISTAISLLACVISGGGRGDRPPGG
ncbi:ATPase component CbiO of energizing module of cobalt ECF transporter [Klebsiella aerogenes]|nr:ATPase component CbiO of energizing module of cobalt ECF transporter [Klebsiella aerogenes]